MYIAHSTQSPYQGIAGYSDYSFPLPSLSGLAGFSTTELALGALAIGGLYWFMKKHHRR